jgi:hypothetical protein
MLTVRKKEFLIGECVMDFFSLPASLVKGLFFY